MLKTVGNPSTRYGDQTILNGNLVIGTAGNGIDFSADPSAPGMTNELLDDYEEGTWTPEYTNVTPPTTPYTMNIVAATYTKVGRLVTLTAYIRTNSVDTTGAAGSLRISGLPFAAAGSNLGFSAIAVGIAADWSSTGGNYPIGGYVNPGATTINLNYRSAVNGTTSDCTAGDLRTGVSSNRNILIFSASYIV